jgi:triacylglycerol lipase
MTYPIVLAHGVCPFDILWNRALRIDNTDDPKLDNLHYFKGVRTMLESRGYVARHARVRWASGVDDRATDLAENVRLILRDTEADKVNIIAHSMGGLDARHMLFNDRNGGKIHERIASLTTISTPHEGSPVADWMCAHLSPLRKVVPTLGIDLKGIGDLRSAACRRFNDDPEVKSFESACESAIEFRTYAGAQSFWGVFAPLKLAYVIIERSEGENDGLVSIPSARWRAAYFQGVVNNTDHLNELGWWDPDQLFGREGPRALRARIHGLYARIAAQLP